MSAQCAKRLTATEAHSGQGINLPIYTNENNHHQNNLSSALPVGSGSNNKAVFSFVPAGKRAAFDRTRQASTSASDGGLNENQNSLLVDSSRNGDSADYLGSASDSGISVSANPSEIHQENISAPHVREGIETGEPVTCGNVPAIETKPKQLAGKELARWAIENYTVDPVQNSKNRWRIRLRCRKVNCRHSDHAKLITVSFMSDSAFRQISRGKKKYERWKKQIKAENARALRQGD